MLSFRAIRRRAITTLTTLGVLTGLWVAAGAPIYGGF